ncbi:competence protein ComK [Bacillus alkalisoli]|uniref:competence protein ComK n=1 Tax=Bacillus alkalisoli TaxID=2011008 RepID=UPI000C239D92
MYKNGADYTGRRNAAVYHTNYKQKTPLLISESLRLVAIPSHSPDYPDCTWIMFHQIANINSLDQETCKVMCNYFTDINLNISAQTMQPKSKKQPSSTLSSVQNRRLELAL